jgi:hypothetical protein
MASNSDAGITLIARTEEFEARLNRAVGAFDNLTAKGKSTGEAIDKSLRQLTVSSKGYVDKLEQSFNALNIKPDISLQKQQESLAANVRLIESHYKKIARDANTSAAEATRAFTAMNDKIRQLNEQPLKNSFSTLNILPTSNIEAQKAKIVEAFNQIRTSGRSSANDVKRAYNAMNAELERLRRLGSTNPVEKVTNGVNLLNLASVAAIVKIQVLYSLVNTTMSAIGAMPGLALDAVESFRSSAVSNAALISSMQTGVKDIGLAYKENKIYAEAVQEVLIKMDTQTAASGKNLNDMNQKFIQQGVLIDANNEKQKQGFLNIANALAALTSNDPNKNLQYSQEVAAMLRGEDRPSNKLFQTLNALDNGKLKEHIKLWKETAQETGNYGLILEKIGPLLLGFKAAQEDINNLWETQKSTLATIRDEILRNGFAPEFDLMISKLKDLNEWAEKNKDSIANVIKGGFNGLNNVIEAVDDYKEVLIAVGTVLISVKAAQLAFNLVVKANPYYVVGGALIWLTQKLYDYLTAVKEGIEVSNNFKRSLEGFKAVINNDISLAQYATANAAELKKLLDSTKGTGVINSEIDKLKDKLTEVRSAFAFSSEERKAKEERIAAIKEQIAALESQKQGLINYNNTSTDLDRANELLREKNRTGTGVKPAVKVPTNLQVSTGETDDTAATARSKAEREAERALRLQTRYREALAALNKSYNEIDLAANENSRKLDLQNTENNYANKVISLSKYIEKKQSIQVAALREEISTNKNTVAEYQKALDGVYASGVKGLIDKAEIQIKINEANKELQASEAALNLVLSKNSAELAKYNRDEIDYVKQRRIAYENNVGSFEEAERIRQTTIEYTNELWRLQQDAIEGVVGAQEALKNFKQQGVIDLKVSKTQDQFKNDDVYNSQFGSDNQFDSITNKYTEMYRDIRNAEDQFGKESVQAQNLRWGATVDLTRDSMSIITDELMKGNKTQFEAGKALSVAMAIMNASLAVSKALTLSYPMNFIVAGLVGASAAVQVSTIMGTQYEGRANGGPVIAGQTYIVNENRKTEGPEYFTPGVNGYITPARKLQDGRADEIIPQQAVGGGGVNVIVNNYGDSNASVNKKDNGDGTIDIEVIIDAMNGRNLVKKGSASNKAIESLRGPQLIRR